jgi:hypothetical protein
MPYENMTTEEVADALGVSLPRPSKFSATVFILQGVHFHIPGRPMTAHATKASADITAADHVNDLLSWIELPEDAKPETWEADLLRARKARAEQMGCEDPDDLGEDDGDVWITELEIEE